MASADKLFHDGEAYERLMGRWSRAVGKVFLDWLDIPKGLRWLDVGCGNGAFTEELIARCAPATVMGIDPSEEQLAYARTRPGVKTAEFRVGDAEKLPFADGSFDVAVMALVISFLSDPEQASIEMARVVRPGGRVSAYMWDIPGGGVPVEPIYVALESMGMIYARPPNSKASQREVMQELWEKAGLVSIDTRVIRIPIVYRDFDDFWESNTVPIGPQGKHINSMSTNQKQQLRSRLKDQLPIASDGRITYASFANAVRGQVPL